MHQMKQHFSTLDLKYAYSQLNLDPETLQTEECYTKEQTIHSQETHVVGFNQCASIDEAKNSAVLKPTCVL